MRLLIDYYLSLSALPRIVKNSLIRSLSNLNALIHRMYGLRALQEKIRHSGHSCFLKEQ